MKRLGPFLFAALLALSLAQQYLAPAVLVAEAAISIQASPSADGTISTEYRNGDKPIAGATCPSGWTCAFKGDATGEIDEVSASAMTVVAASTNDEGNVTYAHRSCGTDDCQIEGQIPATLIGHSETFTGFGVGLTESTADDAYSVQASVFTGGVTRCKYGVWPNDTSVASGAGSFVPRFVMVTNDDSADEIRCLESANGTDWTTFAVIPKALADNSLAYVWGTSHDVNATTSAVITDIGFSTTIDGYTTTDPPGGGAPTLVSPIANQNATQGAAFSLSCAANFSGATSYSIATLPGATGLSFNTSTCALTGTPAAADVGTRTLTVTATNASGSLPESFQFTGTASTGQTFTITSGMATFNCSTTAGCGAGDTLVIQARASKLTISNAIGNAGSPIRIVNDTADNEQMVLTYNGTGSFALNLTNVQFAELDGSGGWVGAAQTKCGGGPCGLKISLGGTGAGVKFSGTTHEITVRSIEIAGPALAGAVSGQGIGIDCNDHNENLPAGITQADVVNGVAGTAQFWREDVLIEKNWIHGTGGSGMYCGHNQGQGGLGDWPVRNYTIQDNLLEDNLDKCIKVRSVLGGGIIIRRNTCVRNGARDTGGAGMSLIAMEEGGGLETDGSDCVLEGNLLISSAFWGNPAGHGAGISTGSQNLDDAFGPFYCKIENNILIGTGGIGIDSRFGPAGKARITAFIRFNTVYGVAQEKSAQHIVNTSQNGRVENNLYRAIGNHGGGGIAVGNGTTQSGNITGVAAALDFVDETGSLPVPATGDVRADWPDIDDYDLHIQNTSTAYEAAVPGALGCPAEDFDGDARPAAATDCSVGADQGP